MEIILNFNYLLTISIIFPLILWITTRLQLHWFSILKVDHFELIEEKPLNVFYCSEAGWKGSEGSGARKSSLRWSILSVVWKVVNTLKCNTSKSLHKYQKKVNILPSKKKWTKICSSPHGFKGVFSENLLNVHYLRYIIALSIFLKSNIFTCTIFPLWQFLYMW